MSDRALFGEDLANDTRTSPIAGPLRQSPPPRPAGPSAPAQSTPSEPADPDPHPPPQLPPPNPHHPDRDRRRRRPGFFAELAEARELRKRVAPRRARAAELH